MVRRRESRVRTVLPVRVFGMDSSGKPFTSLAHTLDITNSGTRLGGLQQSLNVGEIVGVQRGADKARFRVAWVGSPGSHNCGQVGLECIQGRKNIWNVIFEEGAPDTFDVSSIEPQHAPTAAPPRTVERRQHSRHACDIGLEMQVEGSDVPIFARCTDISRGGCYIDTRSPLPARTRVYLCLKSDEMRIRALGEVRSSHPSMGMGIHFAELGEDDEHHLDDLLEALETSNPVLPGVGLAVRLKEGTQSIRRLLEDLDRYDLNPQALRTISTVLAIPRQMLDACRRAIEEQVSPQLLNEALLAEQLRAINSLINEFGTNLSLTASSPSQLRSLRLAAESLLDKLPETVVSPVFDMPFVVTNSRPV